MRLNNVVAVGKREYLQRAKTKAFWIMTLILPLFVTAISVLPALLLSKSKANQRIVVVDETGKLGADLVAKMNANDTQTPKEATGRRNRDAAGMVVFKAQAEPPAADRKAQRADLDRRVLDKTIDAWVWISPGVFEDKPVEYHARSVSNVFTQETLRDDLSSIVRQERFRAAGIDPARVEELSGSVHLDPQRVSATGSRAEGSMGAALLAIVLFFILYISIIMWGQQVMQGVLEEKGSRVIEVVISSVTPFELMMGKLLGICLLGLTQLSIWLGTMLVVTAPGVVASMAFLPPGATLPSLSAVMLINFVLLFILGFLAYATLYAAIGASFNNLQEAQQAAGIAMVFVIIPVMVMYPVINDPNSRMATVLSLIPTFTPLLMPLRIAVDMPPLWELALAYALTVSFVIGMVWFCSKIYRVGILMYGKKPTFQEIWKWTRYA
ncbi:MAG TPA: ABC transporter permease [Thermoanaerobaculia bacterium]|jgi:ABC-2 type transport system permease protein|nr:ABC transporter permease [Thermoanaerobaculia bacterium]